MARIVSPASISPKSIARLQQLRSKILDIPENPTPAIKVLQQPLIGRQIYTYYPPDINVVALASKDRRFDQLDLLDLDLEVRKRKEQALKDRNKRVWFELDKKFEYGGKGASGKKRRR